MGFLNRSFKNLEDSFAQVLLVSSVELGLIREWLFMCSDPVSVPHTCTTPSPQQRGGARLGCLCQESFHPSYSVILPGAPGVCLPWAGGTKAYSQISILST